MNIGCKTIIIMVCGVKIYIQNLNNNKGTKQPSFLKWGKDISLKKIHKWPIIT